MKKVIGFIPARGGSSRVLRKNLKKIDGIPLFLRACYNLHQVLDKENIIVDSDDEEILSIAKKNRIILQRMQRTVMLFSGGRLPIILMRTLIYNIYRQCPFCQERR